MEKIREDRDSLPRKGTLLVVPIEDDLIAVVHHYLAVNIEKGDAIHLKLSTITQIPVDRPEHYRYRSNIVYDRGSLYCESTATSPFNSSQQLANHVLYPYPMHLRLACVTFESARLGVSSWSVVDSETCFPSLIVAVQAYSLHQGMVGWMGKPPTTTKNYPFIGGGKVK